jgi:hypothetical protein
MDEVGVIIVLSLAFANGKGEATVAAIEIHC